MKLKEKLEKLKNTDIGLHLIRDDDLRNEIKRQFDRFIDREIPENIKEAFKEINKDEGHIDINEEHTKGKISEILAEGMTDMDKRYFEGIGVGYLNGYNKAKKEQIKKQEEFLKL